MTINIFVFKGELNGKIVVVRFFFCRVYVHEVLVNRLFKLAQEKVWLGELTVLPWPYM